MRILSSLLLVAALAGPVLGADALPFTPAEIGSVAAAAHQAVQPGQDGKVTLTLADGTKIVFMAFEVAGVITLSPIDPQSSITSIVLTMVTNAYGVATVSSLTMQSNAGTTTASLTGGQFGTVNTVASTGGNGDTLGGNAGGGSLPAPVSLAGQGVAIGQPGGSQANQGTAVSPNQP